MFRQDGLQFRDLFQRNPLLKIPLFQVAAIQQAGQGFFYVLAEGRSHVILGAPQKRSFCRSRNPEPGPPHRRVLRPPVWAPGPGPAGTGLLLPAGEAPGRFRLGKFLQTLRLGRFPGAFQAEAGPRRLGLFLLPHQGHDLGDPVGGVHQNRDGGPAELDDNALVVAIQGQGSQLGDGVVKSPLRRS